MAQMPLSAFPAPLSGSVSKPGINTVLDQLCCVAFYQGANEERIFLVNTAPHELVQSPAKRRRYGVDGDVIRLTPFNLF